MATLVLLREVDPFCAMIAGLETCVLEKSCFGVTRLELLVKVIAHARVGIADHDKRTKNSTQLHFLTYLVIFKSCTSKNP